MGRYSHSSLETFRTCPRKYHYRYIAKVRLPEEPEAVEMFLGSRVHEALEHLYRRAQDGVTPSPAEVLRFYRAAWREHWSDAVVIRERGMDEAAYRAIGERCLEDYDRRHRPFEQTRTLGLEVPLRFTLDGAGKHVINGYIDRLARTADGVWQIHDYKTNRRLPTQADKDGDTQLALYQIGVERTWKGVERVELVWHFLRFDTSIASTRTPAQLTELREHTLATITDIESRGRSEASFPTHESGLCDWCEYQAVCPVHRHQAETEALPRNEFLGEPGVKLVNRWGRLKARQDDLREQLAELEAEVERIQEALLAYARQRSLEVVTGSKHEAVVKDGERTLFPRKTAEPEQAGELEALLRGSRWWKDLSTLDRHRLESLWKTPERIAEGLRAILAPYVRTEKSVSVRLRARKDEE